MKCPRNRNERTGPEDKRVDRRVTGEPGVWGFVRNDREDAAPDL